MYTNIAVYTANASIIMIAAHNHGMYTNDTMYTTNLYTKNSLRVLKPNINNYLKKLVYIFRRGTFECPNGGQHKVVHKVGHKLVNKVARKGSLKSGS